MKTAFFVLPWLFFTFISPSYAQEKPGDAVASEKMIFDFEAESALMGWQQVNLAQLRELAQKALVEMQRARATNPATAPKPYFPVTHLCGA